MNFIENETAQKLRGGYYTPPDLALFLARWVRWIEPQSILEPSCGDGAFFEALSRSGTSKHTSIEAVELDGGEAAQASRRARALAFRNASVEAGDFLQWAIDRLRKDGPRFHAIVGNPPFVRYQYLPELFQMRAETVFRTLGQT